MSDTPFYQHILQITQHAHLLKKQQSMQAQILQQQSSG